MSDTRPVADVTTQLDWAEVSSLLAQLKKYPSVIPQSIIAKVVESSGCTVEDPQVLAMFEVYIRDLLTTIIKEAQGYHILTTNGDPKVLTREDLSYALRVFGIDNHNPTYFVSNNDNDSS